MIDAIVTAGGVPEPGDPLYAFTQGRPKALLDIAGRPMLQWVLDALSRAQTVRRVVVVGLAGDAGARLECAKTLGFLPGEGNMIGNVQAGVRWILGQDASARHALVASSDIPALTPDSVDWNVTASLETDHEVYYSLIRRADMERRFPGSKRSYFKFRDGIFTGSDMNMLGTNLVLNMPPATQALVDARKNIFKQARIIGFDTLLLLALRQLTVAGAARTVSRRLQVKGRAMICPYAEAGMDVDKPAQYELVKRDLEGRHAE